MPIEMSPLLTLMSTLPPCSALPCWSMRFAIHGDAFLPSISTTFEEAAGQERDAGEEGEGGIALEEEGSLMGKRPTS